MATEILRPNAAGMELVKHETCQEYFHRRLSEGWKCISLEGYNAVLLSPEGIRREIDLRNDVAGPNSPGTVADDATVGTLTWATLDYAKTEGGGEAYVDSSSDAYSHYLKATNFGFAIPHRAIINGILVEIKRDADFDDAGSWGVDSEVKIVKSDSSIGTTNKADTVNHYPVDLLTYKSYGGAADLWGEAWAAEDINDADFGVVLSSFIYCHNSGVFIRVDHIRITVNYVFRPYSVGVIIG